MFAILAVIAALAGCENTTRDTDIRPVRLSELRTLLDRERAGDRNVILLIDPRPEKRFAEGHIPGARNIRLPQIDPKRDRDPFIESHEQIVVYGDDPASASARGMVKRLLASGYKRVRLYAGGLGEWVSRGYEPARLEAAPAKP
jgi:rhodanese-related sulfurtransferase